MSKVRLLTLAVLLSAPLASRADTIATFNISGTAVTFGLGGDMNTVSGAATIDTTTGAVQNISYTAGGTFVSGVYLQQGPIVYVGSLTSKISFDAASLIGYNGSTFDINGPNDLYVGHGTMSPASPAALTPEPSSILLFGTGALSLAGVVRRRWLAA